MEFLYWGNPTFYLQPGVQRARAAPARVVQYSRTHRVPMFGSLQD
jgi:hypothetical protein